MNEKRKSMSRADVVKIGNFLKTVIAPPKKPGDCVSYIANWDDEKVAEQFGYRTPAIARLRTELYGRLAPIHSNPMTLLWDRVAKLEARLNALEAHKNGAVPTDDDDIVPAQDRRAYSL